MKTKEVKLNTLYIHNTEEVFVVKRLKNTYTSYWQTGFGRKNSSNTQKIKVFKQMSFILNNGKEVFAKELC